MFSCHLLHYFALLCKQINVELLIKQVVFCGQLVFSLMISMDLQPEVSL